MAHGDIDGIYGHDIASFSSKLGNGEAHSIDDHAGTRGRAWKRKEADRGLQHYLAHSVCRAIACIQATSAAALPKH